MQCPALPDMNAFFFYIQVGNGRISDTAMQDAPKLGPIMHRHWRRLCFDQARRISEISSSPTESEG